MKIYDLKERLIEFSILIVDIVNTTPNSKAGNHLSSQIVRSGTSVSLNYGEAQSSESRKDFIHKMKKISSFNIHYSKFGISKTFCICILLFITSIDSFSQELKGGNGIYTRDKANRVKGWYVGPGISYMFPYLKEQDKLEIADTVLSYTAKPGGKIGLYLEAGYFRFFTKRRLIFDFWDAGLSYKWLRGKETFNQTLSVAEQNIYDVETEGKYSDHFISGNLNFSHKYDFYNESGFWVNTFGLNADYPIISSQSPTPALPNTSQQVPGFTFQLHYKMGYGIKWNDRLWIVPSLETPILNIIPFQNGSSTLSYFNTRARPLLLSVRFMFISQKGKNDCPPVRNPAGFKPDGY